MLAALLRLQIQTPKNTASLEHLPPKSHLLTTITSEISSFFLSALGTLRLEVPDEIQRPADFESTQTEPYQNDNTPTTAGLDLSYVPRFELSHAHKKLRSFIWLHSYRLIST